MPIVELFSYKRLSESDLEQYNKKKSERDIIISKNSKQKDAKKVDPIPYLEYLVNDDEESY